MALYKKNKRSQFLAAGTRAVSENGSILNSKAIITGVRLVSLNFAKEDELTGLVEP